MWRMWSLLLLVSCALAQVVEQTTVETGAVATTRAPPRTLDRQAAELAWRSWLQSPESGNPNAPPRRITTKSLFITPLVCPKGQRLDRNGCVQVVTVNRDEHERILLEQLNALFTSAPSGDVLYDYGDDEPGPLQLSIPIGIDPQASPLQGQDPTGQGQDQLDSINIGKKDEKNPDGGTNIETELELLKLQTPNDTTLLDGAGVLNHNVLNNLQYSDKPKRDSQVVNLTDIQNSNNNTDEGQKELVYGHVNVDPISYNTELQNQESDTTEIINAGNVPSTSTNPASINGTIENNLNETSTQTDDKNSTEISNSPQQTLKTDGEKTKLNPEHDYSDIGEAIKLISRYAEVTTDDNFAKDQKKYAMEDGVLGTRTKLQHRRNKLKPSDALPAIASETDNRDKMVLNEFSKSGIVYRYPWPGLNSPTPPPDYPFRRLQDYWPGRNRVGGVYNFHENPRRHHHTFPHSIRSRSHPYDNYQALPDAYPEQLRGYIHRLAQRHTNPMRSRTNNQDLYSLLGLRHYFSSEGTAKR